MEIHLFHECLERITLSYGFPKSNKMIVYNKQTSFYILETFSWCAYMPDNQLISETNVYRLMGEEEEFRFPEQRKWQISLHKKWSFPLSISSVNCEFGHIYWRTP